jgi:hypothetical protein
MKNMLGLNDTFDQVLWTMNVVCYYSIPNVKADIFYMKNMLD